MWCWHLCTSHYSVPVPQICLFAKWWRFMRLTSFLSLKCVPAIDYIQFLIQQKKKQEDDLDSLRKEVMALKIMKAWVNNNFRFFCPYIVYFFTILYILDVSNEWPKSFINKVLRMMQTFQLEIPYITQQVLGYWGLVINHSKYFLFISSHLLWPN